MRTLIIGGTGFLGAWTTRAAAAAGHDVSILSRGTTKADLPEGVRHLQADRREDLAPLDGTEWDLVIDGCAYTSTDVHQVLDAMRDQVGHYVFVSSVSALPDELVTAAGAPEIEIPCPIAKEPDYGQAKAQAEAAALQRLKERTTIVRPGLIGGPGDHTDRATWWGLRALRGGEALAPGDPDSDVLQLIDARDLAPFLVQVGAARVPGVLHAVGAVTAYGDFLEGIRRRTGERVRWVWTDAGFLEEQGLEPWADLPAWLPHTHEKFGFERVDRTRALAHGLWTRPPHETAADAAAWRIESGEEPKVGLSAEREAELLRAWRDR